jgi:hypothetical protein
MANVGNAHNAILLQHTKINHIRPYREGPNRITQPSVFVFNHISIWKNLKRVDGLKNSSNPRIQT